jgi:hypothetical protein
VPLPKEHDFAPMGGSRGLGPVRAGGLLLAQSIVAQKRTDSSVLGGVQTVPLAGDTSE